MGAHPDSVTVFYFMENTNYTTSQKVIRNDSFATSFTVSKYLGFADNGDDLNQFNLTVSDSKSGGLNLEIEVHTSERTFTAPHTDLIVGENEEVIRYINLVCSGEQQRYAMIEGLKFFIQQLEKNI